MRLQGTVHPRARMELDRGAAPGDMPLQRMTVVFSRTAAQQADLDQLLAAQQDRSSPNYHKWLTPEQFGDRFGLATQDVDLIAVWLQVQGFTVDEIARSRTWIAFSGIAAQVEVAFHTSIHNFVVDGQTHFAPSTEPSIPSAFPGVVAAISGLHDFRPRLHSRVRHASPRLTSSLSGNHYLAPGDFGTIYDLPDYVQGSFQSGNDGSGQTIGIVGQTTLTSSGPYTDNDTFRSISKLPAANFTATLAGTGASFSSSDADEANLDIEWSGAVVPNAAIIFAYSNNALGASLQYLVNQNVASVISISYGDCEANFATSDYTAIEGYFAQANAQGQTVTAAAGDVGAADCDGTAQNPVTIATHGLAVDYPASSVYVTAMGGTEFFGDLGSDLPTNYWNGSSDPNDTSASALSYITETVWNNSNSIGENVATGGGVSKQFTKPAWQTGTGVPADGHRDVPDLALSSSPNHDGYIICSQGSCQTGYRRNSDQTFTIIGGTSAAAPAFAGIAALVNQKLGIRQGNLNPKIYALAASSSWAFNDIVGGDNMVQCQTGSPDCPGFDLMGYSGGAGYDLVTGWGSVDTVALLNAFTGNPDPHFILLPPFVNVSVPAGNNNGIVSVSVAPKQGFTGTISLTCSVSQTLAGVGCSFDNATVVPPATVTLIIQPSSTQGAQTGTVTVQGTSGSTTASMVVNMSFTVPDFQLTSGNSTETVNAGGVTTDTVTFTAVLNFGGIVSFSCNGTAGLTCSLSPTSLSFPSSSVLTVTASSSATSGSITVTGTSGSLTHTLQIPVTVNAIPPDFTLTVANPVVSILSGGLITTTLTVASVGSFNSDVALTCSVTSSLGATTCSLSPTTVTGGNGTSTLTIRAATLAMDRGGPRPFSHRGIEAYATFVFAMGMVLTMKPRRSPRGKSWRTSLLGLLLLGVMLGLVSCGGGGGGGGSGSGPTPLSGTVTVTGTSGNLSHTASITVSIN